jgi:tetratricopeptide (TPR) repeat protein
MPQLRQALDKAEPYALIYAQQSGGALRYLAMLDDIHRLADQCQAQGLDIESELVRRDSLIRRTQRDAETFARALGTQSIPATSHYGAELVALAQTRRRQRQRSWMTLGTIVALVIGIIVYAVRTAPPTADVTSILNLGVAGQLDEAYTVAQREATAFPNDFEVHVWLAVLAEQRAEQAVAEAAWQRAETALPEGQTLTYTRGSVRMMVGDFRRATQDMELLKSDPSTMPEGLFLEAGIAEAQGRVTDAIRIFQAAAEAAEAANRQEMAVIARVRMGNLMQFGINATSTPRPDT